jgi:hypothetical protein
MYERKKEPLASSKTFVRRLGLNGLIGALSLAFSLGIGMLGYHFLENLSWIDSLLNASMILGGMGPVDPMKTNAGKIFASLYAIYSGVILLASVGILIAPIFHRFLHHFHLAEEDE